MLDYDAETDRIFVRDIIQHQEQEAKQVQDKTWELERPIYDMRYDAYWMVQRRRARAELWTYRFTGPVALSKPLLSLLPQMTESERRVVWHLLLPRDFTEAPYGIEVDDDDGGAR